MFASLEIYEVGGKRGLWTSYSAVITKKRRGREKGSREVTGEKKMAFTAGARCSRIE